MSTARRLQSIRCGDEREDGNIPWVIAVSVAWRVCLMIRFGPPIHRFLQMGANGYEWCPRVLQYSCRDCQAHALYSVTLAKSRRCPAIAAPECVASAVDGPALRHVRVRERVQRPSDSPYKVPRACVDGDWRFALNREHEVPAQCGFAGQARSRLAAESRVAPAPGESPPA
jgi:hypothetical protein